MGFPVCINDAGEYVYSNKYYEDVQSLPKHAKLDLLAMIDGNRATVEAYQLDKYKKLLSIDA